MNIIILGAPGSGKGTQARLIAKEFNLHYFESGAFARQLADQDPEIRKIVDSGHWIPEEIINQKVIDYLEGKFPGLTNIIMDGFPRFVGQYQLFDRWLREKGDDIDAVIHLVVSDEEVGRRLSARRQCTSCGQVYNLITNPPPSSARCGKCSAELVQREDDTPEVISQRIEQYKTNTLPMTKLAKEQGILFEVDGERPIDVIFQDLKEIVQNEKNRD